MNALLRHSSTLLQLIRLPVARLLFHTPIAPDHVRSTYRYYTRRHPKYKLFGHKTLGAALVDLRQLETRDKYLERIKGKNAGAHHARRARARGYVVAEIDRNRFVDDIHEINTSCESRQGRPMDVEYQVKKERFEVLAHFKYYGLLSAEGKLVAYANLGRYGNFASFSQLIGHRNNDGTMHLLIVEIVCRLIDEGTVQYLMFDSFLGARPGLRLFKENLGFSPYRAKCSLH